jgi:hypothetical protein
MDKDKDKKTSEWEIEVIFVVLIFVIVALSGGLFYYFAPIIDFSIMHASFFNGGIRNIFDFLIVLSFPVSLILLIGIVVSVERMKLIRKKERAIYGEALSSKAGAKGSPETTNRWRKIVALADSDNQNDWKQAIIDADSILDDMLSKMNYHGDDLGSKLRGATKADFKTLDQAWSAHKVRNDIAHEGSNFMLSKHEAKRIVNLYKQVFEEFFYI